MIKIGDTMLVCGGNVEVHGFPLDTLVTVTHVNPEIGLQSVVSVIDASGHEAIMLIDELEEV